MKNAIWKKILIFMVIPFFIIFISLSMFIIITIFRNSTQRAEEDFRSLGRLNESNLRGTIENLGLSALLTSTELQNLDFTRSDARQEGENVLISSFQNPLIYNAWFIFEPNAFDGRDSEFPYDYPGAPSGRFMRSYIRDSKTGAIIVAPDMNETFLDDEEVSYYYFYPKQTEKLNYDISVEYYDSLYDYGLGEGKVNAMGLSTPIFRNGKFIGAVGFDVILNELLLGEEFISGSVLLVFSPNGRIWFGGDQMNAGKTVKELGFENWEEIMGAFERQEELVMPYNVTPIQETNTYSYFMPMKLDRLNETVFLYAEIPQEKILAGIYRLLVSIMAALTIALALLSSLIFYIIRFISRPIHELTMDTDAISRGDLDREIRVDHTRDDEVGIMSRSLHRMVEQFRVHIALQERSRELLDLHMRVQKALYSSISNKDAFDIILPIITDAFKAFSARLVYMSGKTPVVISAYASGEDNLGGEDRRINTVFSGHEQAEDLLHGRKYILLNSYGIEEFKITFTDNDTTFLCIIPFFHSETLAGYIILEGKNAAGPFIHEDTALNFISDTISYILTQKDKNEASIHH
ncbi:MAG: HAMP domain-containing protein [Treponema sp.]|jgi:HAMP domain-containing protein|nr:HAMP domain-containing protein [Treponema sp.]